MELDPNLEIAEVTDRVSKAYGPALLFEKVKGSKFPVLINAFGSYQRMIGAWGSGIWRSTPPPSGNSWI